MAASEVSVFGGNGRFRFLPTAAVGRLYSLTRGAHPVDGRLLEIARHKVVQAAKAEGIEFKQTYAKEGKELRRRAGGYAHAK